MKIPSHLSSPSVQLGMSIGLLMYGSYGVAHAALGNLVLIAHCVFVGFFIPYDSKLSNTFEEIINLRTAVVSLGRLGRFIPQFAFNVGIFLVLTAGQVFPATNLNNLGGVVGIALLTTCASQGMHSDKEFMQLSSYVDRLALVTALIEKLNPPERKLP